MDSNNFIRTNNKLNVSIISPKRLELIEDWLKSSGVQYEACYYSQWQALFAQLDRCPDIIVIWVDEVNYGNSSLNHEVLSKFHFLYPEAYVFLFGSSCQTGELLGNVYLSPEKLELSRFLFLKFIKYIWNKKYLNSLLIYYNSPIQTIVGVSNNIEQLRAFLLQMSKITVPVLFCGETGVGKDLATKVLHLLSPAQELVRIPLMTWILSDGKNNILQKIQKVVQKNTLNTVYLDRIDLIPSSFFLGVLKALQKCNGTIRLVASAVQCKEELLKQWAQFHEFSPVVFQITPLRERKEDIPVLMDYLLKQICIEYKMDYPSSFSRQYEKFLDYEWYGNGWELKQRLKEWLIYKRIPSFQSTSWLKQIPPSYLFEQKLTLDQIKQFVFLEAYNRFNGDRELICQHLGISKATYFRLKKSIKQYLEINGKKPHKKGNEFKKS